MKFKQIAVATDTENGEVFYGLSEDGTLYEKRGRYIPAERESNGCVLKQAYTVYWWEELFLPIGDPALLTPQQPPDIHLWTDEQVAEMKAKGIISTEAPASVPGTCISCGEPTGDNTAIHESCIPF